MTCARCGPPLFTNTRSVAFNVTSVATTKTATGCGNAQVEKAEQILNLQHQLIYGHRAKVWDSKKLIFGIVITCLSMSAMSGTKQQGRSNQNKTALN